MQIEECIEGEPEISTVRVNPGETNETISGLPNENKVQGEGSVYYDIRFFAALPAEGGRIRLLINLEAQKDYYPGYQIPTRGIFYGARMLSAQLGTEFSGSEYDKLKKVYSIWLCMGVPSFIGNAAAQYHMVKSDLSPGFPDVKQAYDKLTVVVIDLKEDDGYPHPLFGMLNPLLSPGLPAREKKELLQGRYSMKMDYGMEKEVELMCNLSGYVEERAIRQGLLQGIDQGILRGKAQGLAALVRSLKPVYPDFSRLYQAVVSNPEYADLSEEEVRSYFQHPTEQ